MNITFDLHLIYSLLAVTHTLNLKQAAEKLRIAHPALGRMIKGLEEGAGAELPSRTSRKLEITRI